MQHSGKSCKPLLAHNSGHLVCKTGYCGLSFSKLCCKMCLAACVVVCVLLCAGLMSNSSSVLPTDNARLKGMLHF